MPAAARQPPHRSWIELSAPLDFMLATLVGNGAAWSVAKDCGTRSRQERQGCRRMKHSAECPFTDPQKAARRLLQSSLAVEQRFCNSLLLAVVYIAAEILHVLLVPTLVFGKRDDFIFTHAQRQQFS